MISATPHSTYNVIPGSHWPLSGTSASSALFSAAENFRSTCRPMSLDYPLPCPSSLIIFVSVETPSENTCSRFTSVSLVLKMARKQLCPDDSNGTLAKSKRSNPDPLPRRHNRPQQNQATQVIMETRLTKIRRLGCSQWRL